VRSWPRLAGQGAPQAVACDPALATRLLDHVQLRPRVVEAQPLGQRHHLAGSGQDDDRKQVVDELGARPVYRQAHRSVREST